MQGIDSVLLISSSDFNDRIGQHKNVIDAAKATGVQRSSALRGCGINYPLLLGYY